MYNVCMIIHVYITVKTQWSLFSVADESIVERRERMQHTRICTYMYTCVYTCIHIYHRKDTIVFLSVADEITVDRKVRMKHTCAYM